MVVAKTPAADGLEVPRRSRPRRRPIRPEAGKHLQRVGDLGPRGGTIAGDLTAS